jgi:hypothetical protein
MPPLYSTKVIAKGGRHGSVRSEDGRLDLSLALSQGSGRERRGDESRAVVCCRIFRLL